MAKLGDTVQYVGANGPCVALVVAHADNQRVDLAVWEGGGFTSKTSVPQSDDGGGHTWRPLNK